MQSDRSRPATTKAPTHGHQLASSQNDVALAELRRRFVEFRRDHALRTRIPDDLRRAVLDAIDRGTSKAALRRRLGVSNNQLKVWANHRPLPSLEVARAAPLQPARVFAVTGTPSGSEPPAALCHAPQALELRLGTWSVVIHSSCPQ